jgi:metal-dependent amidase/aminoacylase/carboxypeptidase family protein
VLGSAPVLDIPPMAPSDDVSEFLERIGGCYFFVGGGRPDGTSGMHHSVTLHLDEEALHTGALVLAQAAIDLAAARGPSRPPA